MLAMINFFGAPILVELFYSHIKIARPCPQKHDCRVIEPPSLRPLLLPSRNLDAATPQRVRAWYAPVPEIYPGTSAVHGKALRRAGDAAAGFGNQTGLQLAPTFGYQAGFHGHGSPSSHWGQGAQRASGKECLETLVSFESVWMSKVSNDVVASVAVFADTDD